MLVVKELLDISILKLLVDNTESFGFVPGLFCLIDYFSELLVFSLEILTYSFCFICCFIR